MIAFGYYVLKVIACSGILFLYYHIALRNKLFHQWNRFYLLATIILSLLIPCLRFSLWPVNGEAAADSIRILEVVSAADEYIAEINSDRPDLSTDQISLMLYGGISLIVCILFVLALLRIRSIVRSHNVMSIDDIKFVNTEEKDSPFSFFNYVFWNKQIELKSASGEHIFQHELVHVRERHSLDKVFLQVVLIMCWSNPFFWLIRKELRMIHEFIADQKSVGQSDAHAFAAMILKSTYPNHYNHLTNQFFQSSIKRRLTMLTKNYNPKISYLSRVLALPVFAFIILAFTVKTSDNEKAFSTPIEQKLIIVIDAGHGSSTGARAGDVVEDKLALEVAKEIKNLNTSSNLSIILTRENDNNVDLKDRVEFATKNNADLFISLHLNASTTTEQQRTSGYEVVVSNKQPIHQQQSELLGAALVQELSKAYKTFPALLKSSAWVLDKNSCPSVLIECGYITDDKDRAFISNKENQQHIAKRILQAVATYASNQKAAGKRSSKQNYQEQNFTDTSKPVRITVNTETLEDTVDQNFLVIIDGVEKGRRKDLDMDKLLPANSIDRIDVYKGESAIKLYGDKGKQGVLVITTKNSKNGAPKNSNTPAAAVRNSNQNQTANTNQEVTITNRQTETNESNKALLVIDGVEKGTVKDVSNFIHSEQIKAINVLKGTEALNKYGEKGINGVIEIATKNEININSNFSVSETKEINTIVENINVETQFQNKVFLAAEKSAEFPGGIEAWKRYLARNLNATVPSDKGAPIGSYTVEIQFIVNMDGSLSDLKALTQHGYGMEEEAIRLLSRGPKWIPAQQNGQKVAAQTKQKITFVIAEG